MPIGKKGIRRTALYTTALLLAAVLTLPFALTPLINSHAVKKRLAREIHKATGLTLAPGNLELVLAPFPALRVHSQTLDLGRGISVEIGTLSLKLDLSRLLTRQISVDRIHIQNPTIGYTREKKDSAPLKLLPELPSDAAAPTAFTLPDDLVGRLYSQLPDSQGDMVLDISGIKSDYFAGMNLQIMVFKKDKRAVLNATANRLDLAPALLAKTGASLPVRRIQALKTSLVLRLNNQGHLSGRLGFIAPKITAQEPVKPLSAESLSLDFSLSDEIRRFQLQPARILYPGAEIGVIFDQNLKTGKTAVRFSGKDVAIGQAREVCLPLLKGIEVSDHLFDILRAGTAKWVTVGFKAGSPDHLFDAKNLVIKGEASSARVKIPRTPLIAEEVRAKATMNNGVLHIEPNRGMVAGTAIRSGVLDIDLIQKEEVPFSGSFQLNARLDRLPEVLISLVPDTTLARELEKVSQVSGTADAVLGLAMAPGQRELAVTVKASGIRATGHYQRVPLPIRIDKGSFRLEDNRVVLTDLSGALGSSPVRDLTAEVNFDDARLNLTSASGKFTLEELMPWAFSQPKVTALLAPARSVSGTLLLDTLTLSGPMFIPGEWDFSATGSGENMTIGFENHPQALTSVSARFDLGPGRLIATGISARAEDMAWLDFAFEKNTLSSIQQPIQLFEGRVDRTDRIFIHGKVKSLAGPMASFDLSGGALDQLSPTLVALKDPGMTDVLVIPYTDPEKPRFSFEGRLDTRTLEKILVQGSPLHRALDELTGDAPLTIYTDTGSNLHLETRKLNLDLLLSGDDGKKRKVKAPAPFKENRPLLAQKSLTFKAGELVYLDRTFTGVTARVRFDANATHAEIQKAGLCGLETKGRVDISHRKKDPEVSTSLSLRAQEGANVADLVSCLSKSQGVITGTYTFSMNIDGKGSPESVSRNQQGTLAFEGSQGRIYKATILSRVLSVINLLDVDIRQKGFAYKRFVVDADIDQSIVKLKKVYIDAENMAVIASGWLDPMNDKMDVTFLVAPFKTIDTIIKHIPLVNTLLSGRLVSLPARASGSISDPSVVPLAPSAVGIGLINMLTDLVKTPVRLFQDDDTQ